MTFRATRPLPSSSWLHSKVEGPLLGGLDLPDHFPGQGLDDEALSKKGCKLRSPEGLLYVVLRSVSSPTKRKEAGSLSLFYCKVHAVIINATVSRPAIVRRVTTRKQIRPVLVG